MIVYSDRQRSEDPRLLLERLLRELGSPSPDASALLIEAGMLEAGVVDAISPSEDRGEGLPARLGAALLHLARAARGEKGHLASAHDLFADLALYLPPGPVAVSEPEGFAFYALYPETYSEAARRFLEAERPESAVVVGLRSIGTTLSAVVAAELVAAGIPTERFTVRPRSHPWDRQLRLSPDLAAKLAGAQHVLVVDEGPGISGTSFACVAEAARAAGVPEGRIHLFPSWDCDGSGLRSERARAVWPRVKRWTVSYEETFLDTGRLAAAWGGGTLRDLSGGLWRQVAYSDEALWPAVQPQHERRKYLLEREDGTRLLLKFVGLGERGHRMLARAERQAAAGLAPPVHGLRDGVLALGWLDGSPADADGGWGLGRSPAGNDAAAWTGAMARHLAHLVAEPMGPERLETVRFDDILAMTRLNVAEGLGEDALGSTAWMDRMRAEVAVRPAVAVDGRMLPHEWLWTADGPRKCDGLDHHDDHFWPGTQDIAWDLAGAMVEWGFDAEARERLLAEFEALTGDLGARKVLPFYEAAYLAWRLGYTSLAAETLGDSDDGQRMTRDRDVYAGLLRAALERGGRMSPFPHHIRLVIFDADNTLRRVTVPGRVCPWGPDEWEPLPGIREALAGAAWGEGGLRLAIASNQDQVFYGHLSADMARRLLMDAAEAATGHRPEEGAVRFCAHAMDAGCACRKPAPGLLEEAMAHHGIGPGQTLFVGDAEVDREAAARAGVAFLHVDDLLAQTSLSSGSDSSSHQKT